MLLVFWLVLVLLSACFFLLMPAACGWTIYQRYRGARLVTCPENRQPVAVSVDAFHAGFTGINGHPSFRLADCSRWPLRANCGRECMPSALRAAPYQSGEVHLDTKSIYHLPVLIAAFAAWYLGAIWHSPYLFRVRWMDSLGLDRAAMHQLLFWWTPHLLSAAACLLFAYGVAWVLAARRRRGVMQGIAAALFLWAALALLSAVVPGWSGIPTALVRLELAYTLLASLIVGAVTGGVDGGRLHELFQ